MACLFSMLFCELDYTLSSPDHAFYCNADVVLIKKDKSVVQGKAEDVITSENLKGGYGVVVEIIRGTDSGGNPIRACRLL